MSSRNEVIKLATSWLGFNESDGSHKEIIDTYNRFNPLPRNVKLSYTDAWCAAFWSAIAIKLGYTDVMPIEISCGQLIENAKKMGCWVEEDDYIPQPADAILYDWNDSGNGDNVGWADHVGVIETVNTGSGYFTVIEGNYSDSVKKRTVSINGKYIRGFITPKYDDSDIIVNPTIGTSKNIEVVAREAIAGIWGNNPSRAEAFVRNGLDPKAVQDRINEILNVPKKVESDKKEVASTCFATSKDSTLAGVYTTTANLYCRNDAGSNKKALCLIPKNTKVRNYGYYSTSNGLKWLLIEVTVDDVKYTGFSCMKFLKKE